MGEGLRSARLSIYILFAYIGDDVEIGERTVVYPGAFIGNGCIIGNDVAIYPSTTIMDRCILGNRVIIHAGAVIGADCLDLPGTGRGITRSLRQG